VSFFTKVALGPFQEMSLRHVTSYLPSQVKL